MTERAQSYGNGAKGASGAGGGGSDLGPKKTMFVLVVVVGCFAVLWPKVFYPMLAGSANQHIKPSPVDRTTGCCDVISEKDVNTIKIMSEMCGSIAQKDGDSPLTGREMVARCSAAILDTCGIDITEVLQEKVRLGHTTRQILDQVRSLNGSLCLKYNFGVAPWRLGVPHRVNAKVSPSYTVRQERPIHLRSEMVHPAFRERGSAIPQTHPAPPPARPTPSKVMPGRPGPIPAMRPTLGGAGHMVPPPKQSTGTMGLIMPVYTIAIVIFFTYTVMRIVFKKQPESLYPDVTPDPVFRKEVFQSNRGRLASRTTKNDSKLVVNAVSALLDEVDHEIASRHNIATDYADQDVVANGGVPKQEEEQPSVKVLGMETRASCEGGKRWTRSGSPAPPVGHPVVVRQPAEPPQEIYLEGSLPPQSHHLLVSDAATEAQKTASEEDPAVVLAGKMTLSVISLDSSENGTDRSSDSDKKTDDRSSSNVSEDFEKIEVDIDEQINSIIEQAQEMALDQSLLDEIKKELSEIGNEKTSQPITDELEETEVRISETNNQVEDIEAETAIAEIGSEASEQFIASEIEENKPQEAEIVAGDSTILDDAETEVIEAEEDVKPDTGGIEDIENALYSSSMAENVSEAPETFIASEMDEKELHEAEIIAEDSREPDDGFVDDSISGVDPTAKDTFVTSEIEARKLQEAEITAGDDSIDNEDAQESTEEVKTEAEFDVEENGASDTKQSPAPSETDPGSTEQGELDKLNSAIADLGNEFRPKPVADPVAESAILLQSEQQEAEEEPEEEDEEEIEYEYEESDNEDVDDEIRNVGRLEGGEDVLVPQLNGQSTDKAKNGLMGSSSAEDDLTDEEQLVNDDEEVEEIIEYITDDEEEEDEEDVETEHRNNVNHLNDNAESAS